MEKLIIDFSPFDSTRKVSIEYFEAAKRLANYAAKNRAYKKTYLLSSECEFKFKLESNEKTRLHKLSEMRSAGDYFNTLLKFPDNITWKDAGERGRAAHGTKRDISAKEREVRRVTVELLPDNLKGKARTWSAATALINSNNEALDCYNQAVSIIEAKEKEANTKKTKK